jgi:hypothetical protein
MLSLRRGPMRVPGLCGSKATIGIGSEKFLDGGNRGARGSRYLQNYRGAAGFDPDPGPVEVDRRYLTMEIRLISACPKAERSARGIWQPDRPLSDEDAHNAPGVAAQAQGTPHHKSQDGIERGVGAEQGERGAKHSDCGRQRYRA